MSVCIKTKITCPQCGKKIEYDYWGTVNVDLNPELKDKVINQDLFRCHCSCGCNKVLLHSLLYHNMKKKYMVSFFDISEVEDIESSIKESDKDFLLGETFRITTDYNDFINKIKIFDSGFDDKLIEIQKFITYEALKKKGKDIRDKIMIFSAPDEAYKDYHLKILDLSKLEEDEENFIFPIQRDWFEKHTKLINSKEKYIEDVFYTIDQTWANLIAGSGTYHSKNGYLNLIDSYQNEVKQKYKVEYKKEDINKVEYDDSLLKLAVIADDYDRVKELLENGADPNLQPEEGRTALHYALQYGVSKEIIALLIEFGADINACCKRGPKPLDLIYPACSVEYLDYVMSLGAECKKRELFSHFATKTKKIEIIDYLVEKGFSIDERDSYGMNITAEILCNNDDNNFLDQYLAKYGTPNEKYNGRPCIFNEVEQYDDIYRANGHFAKRLKILFNHGADVNIVDNENQTLMMRACLFARNEDTIRFLLAHNPDLSAVDNEGKNVFDYLERNEFLSDMKKERIKLLLSKN